MKASDRQEAGNHYKDFPIQPAEFCQRNRLNWCEANVVKYTARHAKKNGLEDLRKAMHYLELLAEFEYGAPLSPSGEGYIKAERKASLCHSCNIGKCTKQAITQCENYSHCPDYVSALRERMMDAKEAPSPCDTCAKYPCDDLGGKAVKCSNWSKQAPKPAPVALAICPSCDQHPLDFTLPSIALKCTAEQAREKYESEVEEWRQTKLGSMEEMVERWDCLQALRTYYERGGKLAFYQYESKAVMEDLSGYFAKGWRVMTAKAECLLKNAKRGYYHPEVNAEIIASNGHRFTTGEADA